MPASLAIIFVCVDCANLPRISDESGHVNRHTKDPTGLPDVLSTFQSLVRTELIAWSGEMRRIRGNGGRTVKEQKLSGKNCQIIIVTFSSGINAGALLLRRRPLIEGGRRGGGGGKPFFLAGRVMCVRAAEGQTDRLQRMRDVQL